jgi:flagellar biosynthesis GTPase FlhF
LAPLLTAFLRAFWKSLCLIGAFLFDILTFGRSKEARKKEQEQKRLEKAEEERQLRDHLATLEQQKIRQRKREERHEEMKEKFTEMVIEEERKIRMKKEQMEEKNPYAHGKLRL